MRIETLSRNVCSDVLSRNHTARLACAKDGQPYVVPISYGFSGNQIYAFSTVGKKIEWMRANPLVAVEVFEADGERGWRTVVVDGRFEELTPGPYYDKDSDFAWKLLKKHANWWEPGSIDAEGEAPSKSYVYYRIQIVTMTGRHGIVQ
ncbi:pyridoxamine 5'-phosphate oxidase family protein [Mesorhizobium sp. INR15]|uniref:pyridoxamine 5'-phosphate oxidase family protein n=1 Tax=Mesorhizobium sp. INR15 TaxID=2654248 RepID=UPI0018967237|nr:pyridoxamine 5'-phosphate oxidase family protein [Mesorhizobium sp. INR15]QPC91636.1 pyridoxamine 5'-phosphate oxidase family protein [Mesorhizobium sp. INR15]